MGQWDSETVRRRAVSCRLSAYRCCCLLDSIPERKRVQAPAAPGFKPPSGCALGGSGSAHRAGWFKGSYKVHSVEAGSVPPFYNAPEGRHHNPLNPLNPLNLLNLCPHNPSTQPFFTTCREAAPLYCYSGIPLPATIDTQSFQYFKLRFASFFCRCHLEPGINPFFQFRHVGDDAHQTAGVLQVD